MVHVLGQRWYDNILRATCFRIIGVSFVSLWIKLLKVCIVQQFHWKYSKTSVRFTFIVPKYAYEPTKFLLLLIDGTGTFLLCFCLHDWLLLPDSILLIFGRRVGVAAWFVHANIVIHPFFDFNNFLTVVQGSISVTCCVKRCRRDVARNGWWFGFHISDTDAAGTDRRRARRFDVQVQNSIYVSASWEIASFNGNTDRFTRTRCFLVGWRTVRIAVLWRFCYHGNRIRCFWRNWMSWRRFTVRASRNVRISFWGEETCWIVLTNGRVSTGGSCRSYLRRWYCRFSVHVGRCRGGDFGFIHNHRQIRPVSETENGRGRTRYRSLHRASRWR